MTRRTARHRRTHPNAQERAEALPVARRVPFYTWLAQLFSSLFREPNR